MKVLLVNNDSDTWEDLQVAVARAGYSCTPVHHSAIGAIDARGYDVAILSGGFWYDDVVDFLRAYAEEMEFIRTAPIPILGICVGMQLMHVSIQQAVPLMDAPQSGDNDISVNTRGQELFGFPENMTVFKNHTRAIIETDPQFEILATSPGFTEIMIHRTKSLLGVQFHPEVGPVDKAALRIQTLVDALLKHTLYIASIDTLKDKSTR